MEKVLSIIIPAYNAEPFINELLDCLNPQITEEVEVFVIDDGSDKPFETHYQWANVIHKKNGGASTARNLGLDKATGEYVSFIDADDLVSNNYIETIINKIKTEAFDYCYLSWKTLAGGWQQEVRLNSIEDKFPPFNLCVWNRVYKRAVIGNVRFNTLKLIAEDAEFIRAVREEGKKKAFISDFLYYYRSTTPNSLTKRFHEGKLNTRRVVYYFPRVTKNMNFLIDEFRELDKSSEIILMTNQNDIPELEQYAMIMRPHMISGTELRGCPTKLFTKVCIPLHAQVVMYTAKTYAIGGIETFIYNFCKNMSKEYDILVLYEEIDSNQLARLAQVVRVAKNDIKCRVECDTLIVNRISDNPPPNVICRQRIQMVHICKLEENWHVPNNNDMQICVSDIVARTFNADLKDNFQIINNLTSPSNEDRALILVSATRTSTYEKGQKRMTALAHCFKNKNIPFIWLCFCDQPLKDAVEGMIFMKPTLNIMPFIKSADYLVQLSDSESFCYSIVEALEQGVAVLTTPLDVLPEIGFVNGVNGYILPFDINNDTVDVDTIYHHRLEGFNYVYDNEKRINQWRHILGKPMTRQEIINSEYEHMMTVRALIKYRDVELDRLVHSGEVLQMRSQRAYELTQKNFVELVLN